MMYVFKSKKGFTLAELLGVITILAIIALITVPLVNKYVLSSRQKAYDVEIITLKKAAQQWFTRNSTSVLFDEDNFYALDLELLKQSEFLADEPIYNPLNPDEEITGCIMIKKNDNNYSYEYSSTCSVEIPTTYADGTAVYFNPVTGTKCSSTESVSTTGTKTGCMKWYTFNDEGLSSNTINLILDHNTTQKVMWNSTGQNVNGPVSALAQLQTDTSSWTGVPTRTDSYSISNGRADYTINYNGYKARLIAANEIATITGNDYFNDITTMTSSWFYFDSNNKTQTATTAGTSNYDWLFDYTNGCRNYGCNMEDSSVDGYLTSTAQAGTYVYAWYVTKNGTISEISVDNPFYGGVRPVITVLKSTIH